VALPLGEQVIVAKHFHIKPLLPLVTDAGRFFVLALSQKDVRLLECTRQTVDEVSLNGALTAAQDEVSKRGVDAYTRKEGLLEYCQSVDNSLEQWLRDERAPLVLAGADFLLPIYRQAASYQHVLPEGIEGNPEGLSNQELQVRARELVQPHFAATRLRTAALYRQLVGTGRTANDVAEIVAAACQGHIQHLFVSLKTQCWGTFDLEGLQTLVHEQQQEQDEELTNLAAVFVLRHGGTVHAVEPADMPEAAPLAAIYWLPLGERSGKRTITT
jgi:hypothetical protein